MKQKIIILYIWLVSIGTMTFAQDKSAPSFYPDTIRMQLPNGTTIDRLLTINKKNSLFDETDLNEALTSFLKRWAVLSIRELNKNEPVHIKCFSEKEYLSDVQHSITIEKKPISRKITFPLDTAIALFISGNNILELSAENSKTLIYYNSIDQLEELSRYSFNEIEKSIETEINTKTSWHINCTTNIIWIKISKENTSEILHRKTTTSYDTDQILLGAGTGLEYVKTNWNGSFNLNMSFLFGKKRVNRHAIRFAYDWMYTFSSADEKHINQWLSTGYAYNFSKHPDHKKWLGVSLGYLINSEGELFEDNTFRIGVDRKIHKYVTLVPQIYFHDFFKDVYPGLKISISL